jgi:hypothetical protein
MLFFIVFVIVFILIVITMIYRKMIRPPIKWTPRKVFTKKTIWLLWYQGWDHAPWLVQQVRKSWELHNPRWNIVCLDQNNLSQYIDPTRRFNQNFTIKMQAKSDLIRLNLLADYGGVWADATMLCMVSLDRWIYDALQPVGFWMYHGRDNGAGPASWFIISQRQSYIIQRWREAANKFWQSHRFFYDYFWMDALSKTSRRETLGFVKNGRKFRIFGQTPQVNRICWPESHIRGIPNCMRFYKLTHLTRSNSDTESFRKITRKPMHS